MKKPDKTFLKRLCLVDSSTGTISNQFLEGMKQLYELQVFLDVRLLRPGEAPFKVREELLALTGS